MLEFVHEGRVSGEQNKFAIRVTDSLHGVQPPSDVSAVARRAKEEAEESSSSEAFGTLVPRLLGGLVGSSQLAITLSTHAPGRRASPAAGHPGDHHGQLGAEIRELHREGVLPWCRDRVIQPLAQRYPS